MSIYLVRHGQDEDNAAGILNGRRDRELTELGKQQSSEVAEKLTDKNIQVIYSSPLRRTQQTAQIIANRLGIKNIIIFPGLVERDFGILTGKPKEDVPKYAHEILHTEKVDYFLDTEGAEIFPAAYERARKTLGEIKNANPGKNVLLVTHGDIGKMLNAAAHRWGWEDGLKTPFIDNGQILQLTSETGIKP